MASLSYLYRDPFLSTLVSSQNEEDAIANLLTYGTFTDAQLEQLVPLRAYVLCCTDNIKAPDDVFSVKIKLYEKEFKAALDIARSKDSAGVAQTLFSISVERG